MQVEVSRSALLNAVSRCSAARGRTGNLDLVQVHSMAGALAIYATDGEVSLRHVIQINQPTPAFCVLVNSDKLRQVLTLATGDVVRLGVVGSSLTIATDHGQWLLGVSTSTLPAAAFDESGRSVKVLSDVLAAGLSYCLAASTNESNKPALGGVHLVGDWANLILAGTDTRRLHVYHAQVVEVGDNVEGVLPAKACKVAAGILDAGTATVEINGKAFRILSGPWELCSPLLSGRFPDWRKVWPEEFAREDTLPVGDLLRLVRMSSVITSEDSRGVDYIFGADTIEAKSQAASIGESTVSVPIENGNAAQVTRTIDPDFLREMLQHLEPTENVAVRITPDDGHLAFESARFSALICPMAAR